MKMSKITPVTKIKVSKELLRMEKAVDVCDKTLEKAWYTKGLAILKIRESGKYTERAATFEKYLEVRWNYERRYGQRLLNGAEFVLKLEHLNAAQNSEMGRIKASVLPSNERQIRPLLTDLNHDGERIHVWNEVANSGEKKITADLVQRKVDEFKASGLVVEDVEIKLPEVVVPNKVHVAKNSGENEWYTPEKYITLARSIMGSIDTDPATSEIANRTVQAETIYTAEDDGRTQTWRGRVWMNPPYAQPLMGEFAEAVAAKYESGEIEQACILVNNATETKWFQRMLSVASAVCFPKSRIKFLDPQGNPVGAPLQGQAIVYMGEKVHEFKEAFRSEGKVLTA